MASAAKLVRCARVFLFLCGCGAAAAAAAVAAAAAAKGTATEEPSACEPWKVFALAAADALAALQTQLRLTLSGAHLSSPIAVQRTRLHSLPRARPLCALSPTQPRGLSPRATPTARARRTMRALFVLAQLQAAAGCATADGSSTGAGSSSPPPAPPGGQVLPRPRPPVAWSRNWPAASLLCS